MDTNDRPTRGNKRSKSTTRPLKFTFPEDEISILKGEYDILIVNKVTKW